VIPWWWSWLLSGVGVTGLWLAGSRKKSGWLLNMLAQVLWITYAITTEQWGFVLGASAYFTVYARNYLKWYRQEHPRYIGPFGDGRYLDLKKAREKH
jgi:hypothetical protein